MPHEFQEKVTIELKDLYWLLDLSQCFVGGLDDDQQELYAPMFKRLIEIHNARLKNLRAPFTPDLT